MRNKMFVKLIICKALLLSNLLCDAFENSTLENLTETYEFDENENDYYYESQYNEEQLCSINQFISNLNVTPFLPDDYKPVTNDEELTRFVPHINDSFARLDRMLNWAQKLYNNEDLIKAMKLLGARISDIAYESDLDPQCIASYLRIFKIPLDGIQNIGVNNLWALKFFDSFGNLMPSGLIEGRIASFGEYDECLSIRSPPEDGKIIYGKYCTLQFLLPIPSLESYTKEYEELIYKNKYFEFVRRNAEIMKLDNYIRVNPALKMVAGNEIIDGQMLRLGICIPHECRPQDIENFINKVQFPITRLPVIIPEVSCDVNPESKPLELDEYQKFSVIVLSVLLSLVIFSTSFEIISKICHKFSERKEKMKSDNKLWNKIIISFSAVNNTNKLLEINNRFAALDTIRLCLTFGVYSLQVYDFTAGIGVIGLKRVTESVPMHLLTYKRYWFARTAGVWIDGFMFNSGLMLSYSMLNKLKQSNGRFNYTEYMWKRWLRLSISMSGTFLIIYLMPLTGDGPIWFFSNQLIQPACRDKWSILSSFLYYSNWNAKINNYKMSSSFPLCNPPTWFLSASTQLYVFAPIIFLSLYKWPKFGVILNIFAILIGIFTVLVPKLFLGNITYFEMTRIPSIKDGLIYFLNYHTNTLQYVCTFSIGMLTGYLIRTKPHIYLGGRKIEIILWIISFSNIILIYCWNNTFFVLNESPPEISVLLWFALGKVLYGSALAWISFACCTGRGGIVNRFLSIRLLQPIAKLSYGIYLLRVPTIFHRIFTIRYSYVMNDFQTFQNLIMDFMITSILAYFLYILLDCPSNNLIKIFEMKDKNGLKSNIKGELYKCTENKIETNNVIEFPIIEDLNNNNEYLKANHYSDDSLVRETKEIKIS